MPGCRLEAEPSFPRSEPWLPNDYLQPHKFSRALRAGGTSCCPVLPARWPLQFQGQRASWERLGLRRAPSNHCSVVGFKELGGDWGGGGAGWARLVELLGAWQSGGFLRKPSILGKSEIGISDPFRRERMWLRAALGHMNAHMRSECLRIKPSIKQGIINELWVWRTLTLGCRGLDVLSSVTGEWMTGGVGGLEHRRLPGPLPGPAGFSSQ